MAGLKVSPRFTGLSIISCRPALSFLTPSLKIATCKE